MRISLGIIALLLPVVLIPAITLAQAPPSADTFVFDKTPTINYGAWPTLAVQPGATSFLQFNLSGFPTTGVTVNKATLRLYVNAVESSGSFDVQEVDTAWSEKTLNSSNAPPLGVSATGNHPIAVSSSSYGQFLLIDITSLVQNWLSGAVVNHGVALALTSARGSFSFDSKESLLTSHEPELEIVLNGPAGAQGPTGPQGPQGVQGPTGPPGPGLSLVGQSCAPGFVTGISPAGLLVCGCPPTTFTGTVVATVSGAFNTQSWPGLTETLGSGACQIVVNRPSGQIDDLGPFAATWTTVNNGPYTTCTVSVQNPVCNTVLGIPGVNGFGFPFCTSALGATPSTDTATFACQ